MKACYHGLTQVGRRGSFTFRYDDSQPTSLKEERLNSLSLWERVSERA